MIRLCTLAIVGTLLLVVSNSSSVHAQRRGYDPNCVRNPYPSVSYRAAYGRVGFPYSSYYVGPGIAATPYGPGFVGPGVVAVRRSYYGYPTVRTTTVVPTTSYGWGGYGNLGYPSPYRARTYPRAQLRIGF